MLSLGLCVTLAWGIGLTCLWRAAKHVRQMRALEPPDAKSLLAELLDGADARNDVTCSAAIAELNLRLADIAFELGLLGPRVTALARISCASGTALSLLSYIGATPGTGWPRLLGIVLSVVGGLLSAAMIAFLGRTAKVRAHQIRERWDRTSRETGKALGTSLERGAQAAP